MHITTWLNTLQYTAAASIGTDVDFLAGYDYPFLTQTQVCHHIEHLSGHLVGLHQNLRRAVIGYTLYTRQIDRIQDTVSKDFCRDSCDRPPVGCCNASHCDIYSPSDYILYQPTQLSLELAQAISSLQKVEDGQALATGAQHLGQYCPYLTDQGCTLKLFKSPRCAHYLCQTLRDDLTGRYGATGTDFAGAMAETASRAVACCADFTNPAVLTAAQGMLAD